MATQKYYAVKSGKGSSVFTDWDECKKALDAIESPQLKIFTKEDEAYEYLYSDVTSEKVSTKRGERTVPDKKSRKQVLAAMEKKHYAVAIGAKPGVYFTWKEMQEQIAGRPDAKYKCFGTMEEAEQWITATQAKWADKKPVAKPTTKGSKFYAVKVGVKPGVYTTWAECQKNVMGFKNAVHRSFTTEEEAIAFVGVSTPTPTSFSYRIFTDGSFVGGKCGAGSALYDYNNKLVAEKITHIKTGTNNVGELTGIYDGLELFIKHNEHINEDIYDMAIEIVSDSQYCVSLFTAHYDAWTEKEKRDAPNSELIKKIADLLKKLRTVDAMTIVITHINSHQTSDDPDSDISHNNYVDMLADRAANE